MDRSERRRREREELKAARTLRKTRSGGDYVVGRSVGTLAEPEVMDRILACLSEIGQGLLGLARVGYRDFGRGAVLIEIEDLAWLENPPPDMTIAYLPELVIRERFRGNDPNEDEILRKITAYDPEVHAVVGVCTPRGWFSSRLSIVEDPST
jgi:hypothetical protein